MKAMEEKKKEMEEKMREKEEYAEAVRLAK